MQNQIVMCEQLVLDNLHGARPTPSYSRLVDQQRLGGPYRLETVSQRRTLRSSRSGSHAAWFALSGLTFGAHVILIDTLCVTCPGAVELLIDNLVIGTFGSIQALHDFYIPSRLFADQHLALRFATDTESTLPVVAYMTDVGPLDACVAGGRESHWPLADGQHVLVVRTPRLDSRIVDLQA